MSRPLIRILAVLAVLACTVFLVSDSVPLAGAESLEFPEFTTPALNTANVEPLEMCEIAPYAPNSASYLEGNAGYLDDTISVEIKTMEAYNTKVFLTSITIADPTQLRTAPAKASSFDNGKTSKTTANADIIAKRARAVLAINGDYFADRKEGVIVRNGNMIRSADFSVFDALIIDTDGDFHILKTPTEQEFQDYVSEKGITVMHSFSFGPGLIINGERQTEYNAGTMGGNNKRAQRQAICQTGPLSYLCVTTHGPEQKPSKGMTLVEFGDFLEQLGVQNAYNLDGGSSTWLVLNNQKINHKSKRGVMDIIYFATASGMEE